MSKYIPYPFYEDDVPIDISFVFADEKPAGKHGFLTVAGSDFQFEDGTKVKFWGTNINGGANFPDFDYSEKFAKRLSKIGINLVRFHQLDAEWDTPNIFRFTKGPRCNNTTELDPESMKRLDYLIYCLKNEGIYCYLDILTYRRFKAEDGVINAHLLPDAAKPYGIFSQKLIELQKKFAYDIWNHINPYTGLAYKDDAVFVMGEIINEDDLINSITLEPYVSEFRELFRKWVDEKGITYDCENCDVNDNSDKLLVEFKGYLMERYYSQMITFLREIGVKIPYSGSNNPFMHGPICKAQTVCDFNDCHFYLADWTEWSEKSRRCKYSSIMSDDDFLELRRAFAVRTYDRPMFISEWDMPWPNENRAESSIYFAALGLLQNCSGFAIHTYSYGTRLNDMKILGKELSSATVGNIPYRQGMFSTWNDPAKFGLFYHAALMTRRGDISPAENRYAINIDGQVQIDFESLTGGYEISQIGIAYDDVTAKSINKGSRIPGADEKERISDNKQVYRNLEKKYGYVDTERTKAFYGFLGESGELSINDMKVKCKTDYAVIALSSLTNESINNADSMLLTTVGRAESTNLKFKDGLMTDYGEPPVQIEVIEADIELKTSIPNLRVWSVSAEGFYVAHIDTEYKDGVLKFSIGQQDKVGASMYYLIQAE